MECVFQVSMSQSDNDLATQIIDCCVARKVKVFAFDFDLTIVGIHTQGAWMGSAENLVPYIQPWARSITCLDVYHFGVTAICQFFFPI